MNHLVDLHEGKHETLGTEDCQTLTIYERILVKNGTGHLRKIDGRNCVHSEKEG
jgi:hypothetical protein